MAVFMIMELNLTAFWVITASNLKRSAVLNFVLRR